MSKNVLQLCPKSACKKHRLEDEAEIRYFLNTLSTVQREAIILRFGEQLSFEEIAKIMGCNMRTAQSRVRNGLKNIRKEQENNGR